MVGHREAFKWMIKEDQLIFEYFGNRMVAMALDLWTHYEVSFLTRKAISNKHFLGDRELSQFFKHGFICPLFM